MGVFLLTPTTQEKEPVVSGDGVVREGIEHQHQQTNQEPVVEPGVKTEGITDGAGNNTSTVVLDGPLSRIYTEALGQVFALEGNTELPYIIQAQDKGPTTADYFYALDKDLLEDEETTNLGAIYNSLVDNDHYERRTLVMEIGTDITDKAGQVARIAKECGYNVVYSRGTALEAIANILKNK